METSKENKYIAKVFTQVMRRHGMWLGEITDAIKKMPPEEQFDLAIEKNDKIARIPMTDENINRYKEQIRGIFPSKLDGRYLEIGETDMVRITKKAVEEVPTTDDFDQLITIIEPLNEAFAKIGGTPLMGVYHTVWDMGKVRYNYQHNLAYVTDKLKFAASFDENRKAKIRKFIKP